MNLTKGDRMDYKDKYYRVSEFFNDKIRFVAIAIRMYGCHQKPAYIEQELEELRVDKFAKELDHILTLDKNTIILLNYSINTTIKVSRKYHFNPVTELAIGAGLEGYKYPRQEQEEIKEYNRQTRFEF